MQAVKDFKDILEIFVDEPDKPKGKTTVGATRKSTPELLDKIVTYIWDYQQKHNGMTPIMQTIGTDVGVGPIRIPYFMNLLVDSGRLSKISSHPFRVTIVSRKDNDDAIARFKRLRERKEAFEAAERDRIRAAQAAAAEKEQVVEDKATINALAESAQAVVAPRVIEAVAQSSLHRDALRNEAAVIRSAMPQLIKSAEARDLVFELVERGYSVAKTR